MLEKRCVELEQTVWVPAVGARCLCTWRKKLNPPVGLVREDQLVRLLSQPPGLWNVTVALVWVSVLVFV